MNWDIRTPFGLLAVRSTIEGFDPTRILGTYAYDRCIARHRYDILLTDEPRPVGGDGYRARMARKGLYIGHHTGRPGEIDPGVDRLTISLPGATADDASMIFWSYAVKIYLGAQALRADTLHLKAATIRNLATGRIDLLVGRGGGGKTKLATTLASVDFCMLGNTHAILAGDRVWALNTWSRIRGDAREYYLPPADPNVLGDGQVGRLIMVDHNRECRHIARRLKASEAGAYLSLYALGLGAYDLKEDLHDIFGSAVRLSELWQAEASSFERAMTRMPCWYLSSDVEDAACRVAAARFLGDTE